MKIQVSFLFLLLVSVCHSQALPLKQEKVPLPKGSIQLDAKDMKWTDGPAILPKGTKICTLYGDYKKEGPFAIRLKLPPNGIVKTHVHANDEVVTVLDGSVRIGFGDQSPTSETKTFFANSFYVNPAKTKHFVLVGDKGVTIQVNSMGPWTIDFR